MKNLKEAEHLKINLFRDGKKKVDLTFKARTARWMLELLPSHLIDKITARGIDLTQLQEGLINQKELFPTELVNFSDSEVEVRIWLQ
jgi:hypothetical protein